MNITDHQAEASKKFVNQLQAQGFRVLSDLRNEKIGFKIRTKTIAVVRLSCYIARF